MRRMSAEVGGEEGGGEDTSGVRGEVIGRGGEDIVGEAGSCGDGGVYARHGGVRPRGIAKTRNAGKKVGLCTVSSNYAGEVLASGGFV